jgi:UDPglucose 6-dehydrogenase
MDVAVAGLWHLGSVTAACLAGAGFRVCAVDPDAATVAGLSQARPPVAEPGLAELIRQGLDAGRLDFSTDPAAVTGAEVVWVAHDTPVDEDDNADVDFVLDRVADLFPHLADGALVVLSSQLPVGSVALLERRYREAQPKGTASFACVPENLRLGKAIEVFSRADRYVAGVRSPRHRAVLERLLSPFTRHIEWMAVESAEMTKHALNAFLASSVVFINEVAALCEQVGADAREVERGLKSDVRIGPRAYLKAGPAFAGGTLARDVTTLSNLARSFRLPDGLLAAVRRSNAEHLTWPQRRLRELLSPLDGRRVCVLGLTYKPGTSTLRRSSAVEACRWLLDQGAEVRSFDPGVLGHGTETPPEVGLRPSAEEALRGSEAVLIATPWPSFRELTPDELVAWCGATPLVLDPGGHLADGLARDARIRYVTVGVSA